MRISLRQLKAFEFAASATLVTAAIIALPLFAQTTVTGTTDYGADYYASQIASRFGKIGAESNIYDNATINSSAFDLVQYMSDGCYHPSENSADSCKQQFGQYADLKETMDSGALKTILMKYPYFAGVDKLFPAPTSDTQKKTLSEPQQMQLQIDHRSRDVWSTCVSQSDDRNEQNACFQRNIRLTLNRTIDVIGNVL